MSLERGVCSCAELQVFSCYRGWKEARQHATQKKLVYLGFQCPDHPPYSPDLAPSDYNLFPGPKKQMKGRNFSSDAEVIAVAETWLDGKPEFFLSFLQKLEQQAKKCTELRGEYVE